MFYIFSFCKVVKLYYFILISIFISTTFTNRNSVVSYKGLTSLSLSRRRFVFTPTSWSTYNSCGANRKKPRERVEKSIKPLVRKIMSVCTGSTLKLGVLLLACLKAI